MEICNLYNVPDKAQMTSAFSSFLKREDLRITTERLKVLDYIMESDLDFNADDLYLTMRTEKTRISKATIYNTLNLLCKSGLLVKHNAGRGNCTLYTRA
jgi:Fur family ferric uptake transcriptional regulator